MPVATLERIRAERMPTIVVDEATDQELQALQAQWDLPAFGMQEEPVGGFFEFAEAQLNHSSTGEVAEATGDVRPAETEIYGRSLSSIHRLGAFMMRALSIEEVITSPEAAQAKIEFLTSVQEGFGTDAELGRGLEVRTFDERPVINGRVMSKDRKTAISDMTEAGLKCAQETAKKDPRFAPQLTRSVWDHENALIVDAMARGETDYNMRIVASPFPQEAAARSGDAYWQNIGYVPTLKRGFIQLYVVDGDTVISGSLSFDGSDKHKLRAIFEELGVEIPADEITDNWLKYAITGTLSKEKAKTLATAVANHAGDPRYKKNANTINVTEHFGEIMERAFNGSYVHLCESLARGRQTAGVKELIYQLSNNAHYFNGRYSKALYRMRANVDRFTDDDAVVLHELLVYSTIEVMRALHLQEKALQQGAGRSGDTRLLAAVLQSADARSFQNMLGGFGADGARNNRTYSACGIKINLGDDDGPQIEPEWLKDPQHAFGGKDKSKHEVDDGLGPLKFKCKEGHWNERKPYQLLEKCRVKGCSEGSTGCEPGSAHAKKNEGRLPLWYQMAERLEAQRAKRQAKVKAGMGRSALGLAA